MKILSFNIRTAARDKWPWSEHYWYKRIKDTISMLKEQNADVICLQEVTRFQLAVLKYYLKSEYTFINTKCKKGIFGECLPILVKDSQLLASKVVPFKDHFKMNEACIAYIVSSFGDLVDKNVYSVVNIHLHLDGKVRSEECKELANQFSKGSFYKIICGDCNDFPEGSSLIPFKESFKMVINNEVTYHGYSNPKDKPIDNFFISSDEYQKAEVLTQYKTISDHYPIVLYI